MLSRLALRLAAIETLAPAAVSRSGPWPTIAGPYVYDSRQEPLDAADELLEARPILLVYTEQGLSEPYPKGVSKPDNHTVLLVIEAMIAARALVEVKMPDGSTGQVGELEVPISDREHEALLDLLEATVRRRLEGRADAHPTTQTFRMVAMEIQHVETVPMRDATNSVRLAGRTITLRVKVPCDAWPEPSLAPAAATGLERLPNPLRLVASRLPATSSGRKVCDQLAALLAQPDALVELGADVPADGRGGVFVSTFVDRGGVTDTADANSAVPT